MPAESGHDGPLDPRIPRRFETYAALRNLRFGDAFLLLFYLHDLDLGLAEAGALLALEKWVLMALEVPLAVVADRVGRRRTLMLAFFVTAVALAGLAWAAGAAHPLPLATAAVTVMGVGEALRTGTHKALMLDWLGRVGASAQKTSVVARQRMWSKTAAGVAALGGGLMVWSTGRFAPLFWASVLPALLVVPLIATYPAMLDAVPRAAIASGAPRPRPWALLTRPGVLAMLVPSVLFESQVKLALAWLQPFFEQAAGRVDLVVVGGVGAVALGAYGFATGVLAGGASILGLGAAARWGAAVALRRAHGAAAVALAVTALGLACGLEPVGLAALAILAALQNARRPLFVAALDEVMDGAWRATTLSIESQLRGALYGLSAVALGALADATGVLWTGFAVLAVGPGVAWLLARRG